MNKRFYLISRDKNFSNRFLENKENETIPSEEDILDVTKSNNVAGAEGRLVL